MMVHISPISCVGCFESTLPVSPMVSCPPSWIMPGPKYCAWPPIWLIAVSNETRVRVLDC